MRASIRPGTGQFGGVASQAGADGLWNYSSDYADRPNSPRRFSVRPRLGGMAILPTRVDLDEYGRPIMRQTSPTASAQSAQDSDPPDDDEEVLSDLRAAGAAGVMRTTLLGSGAAGTHRRNALTRLIEQGRAVERAEPGSSRGRRVWAVEHSPP